MIEATYFVCLLVSISPLFFQLPSIITSIFPTYLDEHPASKYIYNAFVQFLFSKFSIAANIQNDFAKWSRQIISNSFRIPPPAAIVHPSHDFDCPPPAGMTSLLIVKGEQTKKPLVTTPLGQSRYKVT